MFEQVFSKLNKDQLSIFTKFIENKRKEGWLESDIFTYVTLTEEVSPEIPEDIAIERMNKIIKKYT